MSAALLIDFDGTLCETDLGDSITHALLPPDWVEAVERAVRGGEHGSRVAQATLWEALGGREAEALALAARAEIDPAAPALLALCAEMGIEAAILSDGMAFYIRAVLERCGLEGIRIYANEMDFRPQGARLQRPHANPQCDWCACCKAAIVRRHQANGQVVLYVGDGYTDQWAAAAADLVFAKGALRQHLAGQGRPFVPVEDLRDVVRYLRAMPGPPLPGSRVPDPTCRF